MSLKLWHVRHSRSLRPLWLAKEMGVEMEVETVPNDRAHFASEEWARVNPAGKIPVLYDGDVRLAESVAIMEYLMATRGPTPLAVGPGEPDYADWLFWLHYAEAGSCAYVATYLGHVLGVEDYQVSDAHKALLERQIARAQALVADAVADRDFLLARGFTAADIAMGYTLHLTRLTKTELTPPVAAYMARLDARPAFAESLALGRRPRA